MAKKQPADTDRLVILATSLLVLTRDSVATTDEIRSKAGTTAAAAKKIVATAQERINAAADTDVRAEIGTAKIRLNNIYELAIKAGEILTALDAAKEMNKLLKLNTRIDYNMARATIESDRDAIIRRHLSLYEDMPDDLPLEELARRVALRTLTAKRGDVDGIPEAQAGRGGPEQADKPRKPGYSASSGDSRCPAPRKMSHKPS